MTSPSVVRFLVILPILLFIFHSTTSASNMGTTSDVSQNETSAPVPEMKESSPVDKWRQADKLLKRLSSQMVKKILPLMVRASEDINVSSKCARGLMKMLTGIKQMKLWAFKMLDSSGKLPNGLLKGTINSLGEFDSCLEIDVPGHFQGKYCTVEIVPPLPKRIPFTVVELEIPELMNITDSSSVLSEFMRKAQHYHYLNFRSSVCVPSTCSAEDIREIGNKVVESIGLEFEFVVPNCEVNEAVVLDKSDIVIICVLVFLLLLGISGTLLDVVLKLTSKEENYQRDSNILVKCLICFSFYTNTKRLLKEDTSPDTIKIFHGMKVITVLWVILNHNYYYLNYQALAGLLNARQMGKEIPFQLIANGFLNVETFFFISAVLVSYGVIKMKEKRLNVFLYVFRRLWRLTPPFMLVIATSFLIPHMGSGPVWRETVVKGLVDKCKSNWWTNLLYFNNMVDTNDMCFQWLWYIPVDTHLYFLALIVLIPLKSNPRLAFLLNGLLLAAGLIATVVSNIFYELHPTAIYAYSNPDDINYFVNHGYFPTYLHISTYCVGMPVGYIIATKKKLRIPLGLNILGWLTAFIMALSVLYGVYDWNQGNVPGLVMSTVYTCTNKLVWSLALSWVTIMCFTGNGGIATSILTWKAFVPLSRLTYMAYLIHPVIQYMYMGSTRVLLQAEHRTMVYMYLGHVVVAFICACGFSLLFESPFMALEKVIFSGRRPEKSAVVNKVNDESNQSVVDSLGKYKKNYVVEDNGIFAIHIRQMDASG